MLYSFDVTGRNRRTKLGSNEIRNQSVPRIARTQRTLLVVASIKAFVVNLSSVKVELGEYGDVGIAGSIESISFSGSRGGFTPSLLHNDGPVSFHQISTFPHHNAVVSNVSLDSAFILQLAVKWLPRYSIFCGESEK